MTRTTLRAMSGAMAIAGLAVAVRAQSGPPAELPPAATGALHASLAAAASHDTHVWRDPTPLNADGTVNAYIEIPRGERRKYELDMRANTRRIDRVLPEAVGGYPVNYGFVPQTISYDGDPFDALVLGPPLEGGGLVRGVIVGLMQMEDEKGHDAKVVLSRVDAAGRPTHRLTAADRRRIADYFARYKRHQPGGFSRIPGWGSADEGLAYVRMTHAFFRSCRSHRFRVCRPGAND